MAKKFTAQSLIDAENEAIDCLTITATTDWLPENYIGKRKRRNLRAVVNQSKRCNKKLWQDPNEISVKFDDSQNVVCGTPERMARLSKYSENAANESPIDYNANDDRLYRKELVFCEAMVRAGIFESDDFTGE